MHDPIASSSLAPGVADGESSAFDGRRIESRQARLSIVVLSHGAISELHRALVTLLHAADGVAAELIVVRVGDERDVEVLRATYREATIVAAARDESVADMRSRGNALATGDVVLLRDDRAVGDARWLAPFTNLELTAKRQVERERLRSFHVSVDSPATPVPAIALPSEGSRAAAALPRHP